MYEKRLYSFSFDFGRGYEGYGIFWAYSAQIKKLIDRDISFGEICGKHSNVDVTIEENMIQDITDRVKDESFCLGLQPLNYLPKFDEMRNEDGSAFPEEEIEDPLDIDFDVNSVYAKTFYTYSGKEFLVFKKEQTEDGKIIYYAKEVEPEYVP